MKKWTVISLIGLCLLFVALQWNSFNAPFERDEGHYAYGAWIMTKGLVPYINTFEIKPPLIFAPYLLALFIDPNSFWPIRLIASLFLALTAGLAGLVAGREFGRRAGWMAMWLTLPMVMFPPLTPFAANTERFMLLPLMGLLAIYVYYQKSEKAWFWAAVCGMCAILFKQIALLAVLYIFLVWLIETGWQTRKVLWASGGALLALFLTTGYFIARGALPGFWEQMVVFNRYYIVSSGGLTLMHLNRFLNIFVSSWPALFLLLAWLFFGRPRRIWFYLGLLAVSLLTIFTSPYGHYYILLMPVWAIVSAASLDSLAERFSSFFKRPDRQTLIAALLLFLVIGSMLWPVRNWYLASSDQIVAGCYGPLNPFIEAPLVAKRVAELTKPDDYVYIAGTEPEILYYAKRLKPVRSSSAYELVMNHPRNLDYQKETICALDLNPPEVVVWVRSPLSWLANRNSPSLIFNYFDKVLKTRYRLVGGAIRRGASAYWEEPLRAEDLKNCSIKVYQLLPEYSK